MNGTEIPVAIPETKPRSTGALILFLFIALTIPLCSIVYHFSLWSTEQTALMSLSARNLEWAGPIGLFVQGIFMSVVTGLLWRLTKDGRFTPIYFGWFVASLMAFPALGLRALGPNNDQSGAIIQFLLCALAALIVMRIRKTPIQWRAGGIGFGLIVSACGVLPLAIYGSFGSSGDAFLTLLAGISLGVLSALLMEASAENVLLDACGIAALLSLLSSAIGYDGGQLILLAMLPPFAFAIAALLPSKAGAAIAVGLLAFAGLAFFDPTELTFLLGDVFIIAFQACGLAIVLGFSTGILALLIRGVAKSSSLKTKQIAGWIGGSVAWALVLLLFIATGNPGNYGDRLFVIFKDQADISNVAKIKDRDERLRAAYDQLTDHANKSQSEIRKFFDSVGVKYTPYYLENAMEVQGGTLVRIYLITRPEVDRVIPSPRLRAVSPDEPSIGFQTDANGVVQWNVSMIGADKVWDEFGARGQGIVVGEADTGVDGDHPAIRDQYRGATEGDDYNWFDPWDGTTSPNDEAGHGTHTTGTILGRDGIGVAPEAQWIGCVNLDRNLGNPALYLDCMQFMLAPFPHRGDPFKDGDPTKAAHVLNNSWGCPAIEGCDANALKNAADNLRYAGIFVVVSTGNDGPNCNTVEAPLSLYESVFSVGAMDQNGDLAYFSSRGPVLADGSQRVKPDIVAPGVDIFSSMPGNTYASNSGTSMAGPHVVGAVALIWSAVPDLIGDIDATEQLIMDTARPYTGDTSLGCFSDGVPNNAFGYGLIDVYAAVKKALGK